MWTNEIVPCTGCGSEVALITDGRVAYVYVATAEPNWRDGETVDVWREGIVLMASCPARHDAHGDRCGEDLVFPGEGTGKPYHEPLISHYCEPILEERP